MSELKPCPFCGGGASVEEIGSGDRVRFSVGCSDEGGDCYGYQSLTSFPRRCEAIAAWNRRPDAPRADTGWMPIETAPKDGTEVLLLIGGVVHTGMWDGPSDGAICAGRPSLYNWFSLSDGNTHADRAISHWMPEPALPAPPQADGAQG